MSDLFGGNYQAMILKREENGTLTIVEEGTEHQIASRDALKGMVRDFNTMMARVDIWKDKWERAEERYRDVSRMLAEERARRETLERRSEYGTEWVPE